MFTLSVIIPAAGSGERMKSDVPKPFIKLHQKTILEHTIEAFGRVEQVQRVIVAASADFIPEINSMFSEVTKPQIICVEGGSERQHSVFNAMDYVGDVDLVAVHDAVRPFVTVKDIIACCNAALNAGAAILAVKPADTVKIAGESGFVSSTLDRNTVWLAQTPQIFKKEIITKSYQRAMHSGKAFTDDASLVEHAGFPVQIVPGSSQNFKITYPADMERAKTMMNELWQK